MGKKPTARFFHQLCNPFEILLHSVWKRDPNGGHSETTAIFAGPANVKIEAVDWEYYWPGLKKSRKDFTLGPVLILHGLPPGVELTVIGHICTAKEIKEGTNA